MKKIILFAAILFSTSKLFSQQLARATDVQMVTTAGTKIVLSGGGISFIGTSVLTSTADSIYLIKSSATSPEGWLDSTAAGVMAGTSTGHVFFMGNNRQSFYGKTKFYDFTLRNTGGDTLLSSCEVRNLLHLDTGYVYTKSGYGNDSLLVSNPATTAIVSTSNFTKSWVDGRLSRKGNVTSPSYLFPVGKTDSLYAPVKLLKLNTNAAIWTAEYFPGLPFNYLNVFSPPIDHISRVEYWEISSNQASGIDENAKVSLSWRGHSRVSATASIRDSLLVAQYINRPPMIWDVPGGWVTGNAVGPDSLSGYVTANAYTTFDSAERRFTLATYSKYNSLPIRLVYFTAVADGNRVRLNWEAANEQDTRIYEIEKSLTGSNFSHFTNVTSRQQVQSDYVEYDPNPALGWNYYRLKIIDKQGNFTYSPIRPVEFKKGKEELKIFPVPATDVLNIQLPSSYVNNVTLQLFTIDARIISTLKPTNSNVQLNVTPLPAGTYVIRMIKTNGDTESHTFIKQ